MNNTAWTTLKKDMSVKKIIIDLFENVVTMQTKKKKNLLITAYRFLSNTRCYY